VTSMRRVTDHAGATPSPAAAAQVKKLGGELATSQASVSHLRTQLKNTRQRNKQLRAQLRGTQPSSTKGK